jgi:hypothetical protein
MRQPAETGRRSIFARSPTDDVHPKVSAPQLSQLAAVPLAKTHVRNPRVVASERLRCGVSFLDSDRSDLVNGRPR